MRNLFCRRPAKAVGYRSNQWKGARAMQSKNRALQTQRSQLAARCCSALRLSGWLLALVAVGLVDSLLPLAIAVAIFFAGYFAAAQS